ncbi:hypothetical protein [Nocardia sp. NBC_01329]|uniref:hypothetical protein n=1 Tax=Nocardia sp. NBC_01329 TaxID=2903594 RepID=UPI002E0FD329|nr:hypothetical protein OG405_08340 [Nocardia sp. NBC_01329]
MTDKPGGFGTGAGIDLDPACRPAPHSWPPWPGTGADRARMAVAVDARQCGGRGCRDVDADSCGIAEFGPLSDIAA